jgi:hypothetical protein
MATVHQYDVGETSQGAQPYAGADGATPRETLRQQGPHRLDNLESGARPPGAPTEGEARMRRHMGKLSGTVTDGDLRSDTRLASDFSS